MTTTTEARPQSAADISEETLNMLRKLYDRSKRADSHLDSKEARAAAEAEATQAAEMLGRLLDKYGLALADVDSKGHSHQISHGHVQERTINFGKSNFGWKIALARVVIRHNNCKILQEIVVRNKIQGFVLIGLTLHVEASMMLLEWLFGQIKIVASADYRAYKAEHPFSWEHIDPLRWHTSFGQGAGARLATRLELVRTQQRQAEDAAHQQNGTVGATTALAVNISTAIRDYLEAKEPWRKEARLEQEAYEARWAARRRLDSIQTRAWGIWLAHQAPVVQIAAFVRAGQSLAQRQAQDEAYDQERQKAQAKRAAYEDRYYRKHGHYPGEGRRRKAERDNTEYTAFDAGYERAETMSLSPFLGEGASAAPAALAE